MYVFILTKCLLHMAALADGLKFFLLIAFNNYLILVETSRDWYIETSTVEYHAFLPHGSTERKRPHTFDDDMQVLHT